MNRGKILEWLALVLGIFIGLVFLYLTWKHDLENEGRIQQIKQEMTVQIQTAQEASKQAASDAAAARAAGDEYRRQGQILVAQVQTLLKGIDKLRQDSEEMKTQISKMPVPQVFDDIRSRIGPQTGTEVSVPPLTDNDVRTIDSLLADGENCQQQLSLTGQVYSKCEQQVKEKQGEIDAANKQIQSIQAQAKADLDVANAKATSCQSELKLKTPSKLRQMFDRALPYITFVLGVAVKSI